MSEKVEGTSKSGWCLTGQHHDPSSDDPRPQCQRPECPCECHGEQP